MNEKEKKDFYIATCRCCLIAQAMKHCPVCQFNVGLAEQHKPASSDFLGGAARIALSVEDSRVTMASAQTL